MNTHQQVVEQYRISMEQYKQSQAMIDQHFEREMRFEAESFDRMKKEFEAKMDRLAAFKEDQTVALKAQYAISD